LSKIIFVILLNRTTKLQKGDKGGKPGNKRFVKNNFCNFVEQNNKITKGKEEGKT
jgi:hypothetical protein